MNNFGNVETIGDSAFNNCTSLTTVDSFNSTKTIGNSAFNNCSSLTKIKFSNNLTSIGTSAFENCKKVTSTIDDPFIIPNSVTNLGSSCFREMDGLVSVKFESGSTLTEIPNMAFDNCNNLAYITFPDNITTIGSIAFWGCGFKNITIPKTVTTIGSQAFESCGSLESVTFEENEDSSVVLSIGDDAFLNCKNSKFTTLNLTGRTFTIGSNSFGKCSNLTTITIGSGVTKINDSAFSEDTNISTVTFKQGNDVLYLGSYIFDNCKITKLDFSKRAVKIGYIDNSSKKNTFSNCKSLETSFIYV